jgi:hypothetical protein
MNTLILVLIAACAVNFIFLVLLAFIGKYYIFNYWADNLEKKIGDNYNTLHSEIDQKKQYIDEQLQQQQNYVDSRMLSIYALFRRDLEKSGVVSCMSDSEDR